MLRRPPDAPDPDAVPYPGAYKGRYPGAYPGPHLGPYPDARPTPDLPFGPHLGPYPDPDTHPAPDPTLDPTPYPDRDPDDVRPTPTLTPYPTPYSHPDPVTAAGRRLATTRLLLARGHTRAALTAAARRIPAAEDSPWDRGHAALTASAAHLAAGSAEAAAEVLRAVADDQPLCRIAAARAYLAAGDRATALSLLDGLPGPGRSGPAVSVRAALVRARVARLEGDLASVHRLLGRALREAGPEELRRPFLEAGPWIAPFLTAPSLRPLAAGWLAPGPAPVSAPGPAPGSGPAPTPVPEAPVEPLSARERDVLSRLARTMSTEEIAADLYVSVNTVKTHLKSVYRKLSVHRRNEAVRRARDLGLL
ncbi:LuxR C-terminal-related transcriptional regulator [Streptomyces sp. SKN60]|nr:LuxR C-terminal-related transcriptional regulator [Streptomyces sp. SKN60]